MKIKKHIDNFFSKYSANQEKLEKFSEFMEEFFAEMPEEYYDVKEAFEEELEEVVNEIDEDMIKTIVENLKFKDGKVSGEKWSKEETINYFKQYDVKSRIQELGKDPDELYFYFSMNYVYAVHNDPNRTINGYINLAIDEITNKNLCISHLIKKIFKKI